MDLSDASSRLQRSDSVRSAATVGRAGRTEARSVEKLAEHTRDAFDLPADERLISSHPCWLFRSIQLHGIVHLFTNNICFYATLPRRQDKVLLAGSLRKEQEGKQSGRSSQHHAVLRSTSLSWYESERDPYFPQDKIDLCDVLAIEERKPEHDQPSDTHASTQFVVSTRHRTFRFSADAVRDRDDWLDALRKAVFRAQNDGESVRIVIPLEAVFDVDDSQANPLAGHTTAAQQEKGMQDVAFLTIKVIQSSPGETELTMDEYFFTNMVDEAAFIRAVREKMSAYKQSQQAATARVRATVGAAASLQKQAVSSVHTRHQPQSRQTGTSTPPVQSTSSTLSLEQLKSDLADATLENVSTSHLSSSGVTLTASEGTSYPPTPPGGSVMHAATSKSRTLPLWLRDASSRLATSTSDNLHTLANRLPLRAVREVWSVNPHEATEEAASHERDQSDSILSGFHDDDSNLSNSIHSSYSILETDQAVDEEEEGMQEALEQFRTIFSLPASERLVEHSRACLYRFLPVMGRLYISTNYICFRSSNFFTNAMGRTLMILPCQEIVSVCKNNAVQYGRHGLVIIVRGHEELFLEFNSPERRDQCISLIDFQLSRESADDHSRPKDTENALLLTDAVPANLDIGASSLLQSSVASLHAAATAAPDPPKPRDGLHFTILTIGSRGDVQPYIALAKGLQREGHRVRIATHDEFGHWIRSHGIDFYAIGGDPAELMRICVENGTFTLAFVRESVTHFRGWLDDLLLSCWQACQGTDVIIESPSALAGIHVAEALGVPYYRAFTMPWTRTRAYPHAFAVPSGRAGGNYNYMSYVIFDQVLWRASAGQINGWRSRCLNLRPTNLDILRPHEVPFLYNFSPHLVPRPLDWADWVHITGFWFLDNADSLTDKEPWAAPSELLAFIAESRRLQRKLVYIGWGSIVISQAEEILNVVVEAVRKSGVRAIVSKGWSDRLKERSVVDVGQEGADVGTSRDSFWRDIYTVDSIPHDWLFPQVDVACHHGGSGTLGASLRAGIPTIVRPFFGDQFFWAKQVDNLHIGHSISDAFTAERFASALNVCTTDVRMRKNARVLADKIAKEDGVKVAINAIYSDWDRACHRMRNVGKRSRSSTFQQPTAVPGATGDGDRRAGKDGIGETEEDDDDWSVVSSDPEQDRPPGQRLESAAS